MISLDSLNTQQRLAAETISGPVLILAGAGSGKTKTLTFRMAHMISNLNIRPSKVLAVTFTNKAAGEMKERVVSLIGRGAYRMTISTFHALGVKILREDIEKLGYSKNFNIYDTGDQQAILRDALKIYQGSKNFDRKTILAKISCLKNNGIDPHHFKDSAFFNPDEDYDLATEHCYDYYQQKLKFFNVIDFDDILRLTVKLLKTHPELAEKYSKRFEYIMIDEYQDTNPLQFELVKLLTCTHQNLCVVGDDDQSIYGFRGADVSNILGFEKLFPGCRLIKLEQNYRSNMNILDLANQVIIENKNRKEKKMWSSIKSESLPFLWATGDTDHEAGIVIDEIMKMYLKDIPYKDMAILYRGNNQNPPFEEHLRMNNIPYRIVGGQKFYDKKEIKDLLAYLSLINNKSDELALRRIINVPRRGIGQASLNLFLDYAKTHKLKLFDAMEKYHKDPEIKKEFPSIIEFIQLIKELKHDLKVSGISECLKNLIRKTEFGAWIDKQYENKKQADVKQNAVNQFVESAERFEAKLKQDASLKLFLEKLLLQDNQDETNNEEEGEKDQVTLMTLHSSKGLEFPIVFLVGVEDELLPHKKCIDTMDGLSEERRLLYVGVTRAKEKLIMTYSKIRNAYGKDVKKNKSRFLHNKDNCFIFQDRTRFDHMSEEETKEYKKNFFNTLIDSLE